MPQYYSAQNGPAAWASEQQSRRDNQIRDILNMMMQMKNFQTEQGWKQKEWDTGLATDEFNQGQAERRTAASELSANSLANQRAEPDPLIQQADILVETGMAKNRGDAIRQLKGIKTIDEEVALEIAKAKAKEKAGLGADKANPASYDPSLNYQKQLTDLSNFLEQETRNLETEKAEFAGSSNESKMARVAAINGEIADKKKRMNRARSLASRFTDYLNKNPDAKLVAETKAFLGGEERNQQPNPFAGQDIVSWPMAAPNFTNIPPPPVGFFPKPKK